MTTQRQGLTPVEVAKIEAWINDMPQGDGLPIDACLSLVAEVRRLHGAVEEQRGLVERLWKFSRHLSNCPAYEAATNPPYTPCDCGFDELRRELFPTPAGASHAVPVVSPVHFNTGNEWPACSGRLGDMRHVTGLQSAYTGRCQCGGIAITVTKAPR